MSINNLQQLVPYRQESIYNMPMAVYDPQVFADWLDDEFRRSRFKSQSELAAAAGLQRSTISSLINSKIQFATNKSSRPKPETVIKIAQALNVDVNTALLKAGHAPIERTAQPRNMGEFLEALESLGVEQLNFSADPETLENLSRDDYEELIERIKADIEITIKRKRR